MKYTIYKKHLTENKEQYSKIKKDNSDHNRKDLITIIANYLRFDLLCEIKSDSRDSIRQSESVIKNALKRGVI